MASTRSPQSLPSGDFGECQNGQRKDEDDRTKCRSTAVARRHGSQPQHLRIEGKLVKG